MKRIVAIMAIHALTGASALAACSSDEASSTGDGGEGGLDAPLDAPRTEADVVDGGVCEPQALDRQPHYTLPRPWYQDACTPAQIGGYYTSCFLQDPSVCDAFKQQNAVCFACLDTSDTDPSWGPSVRFANRSYSEPNFAGCVANALGETGDTGCGAAQGLYEDCRRLACRGCLPIVTQADYNTLSKCGDRTETNKICASYIASRNVKCADHLAGGADDPTTVCAGTAGMSELEYFRSLAALWCMPKPEGGVDGGDAGTH